MMNHFDAACISFTSSVLSEAYSTRYKNALHTHAFDNAVKRYRVRSRSIAVPQGAERPSVPFPQQPVLTTDTTLSSPTLPIRTVGPRLVRTRTISAARSRSHSPSRTPPELPARPPSPSPSESVREAQEVAQQQLEALPYQVLQHARTFHEHVKYFVGGASTSPENIGGFAGTEVPESLKQLLDDISGQAKIGERMKEEIFQDEDARHVGVFLTT
jgi:potassium channel subfamily K